MPFLCGLAAIAPALPAIAQAEYSEGPSYRIPIGPSGYATRSDAIEDVVCKVNAALTHRYKGRPEVAPTMQGKQFLRVEATTKGTDQTKTYFSRLDVQLLPQLGANESEMKIGYTLYYVGAVKVGSDLFGADDVISYARMLRGEVEADLDKALSSTALCAAFKGELASRTDGAATGERVRLASVGRLRGVLAADANERVDEIRQSGALAITIPIVVPSKDRASVVQTLKNQILKNLEGTSQTIETVESSESVLVLNVGLKKGRAARMTISLLPALQSESLSTVTVLTGATPLRTNAEGYYESSGDDVDVALQVQKDVIHAISKL